MAKDMVSSHLVVGSGFEAEFMPRDPVEAVKAGDFNTEIDYLFGVNDDEGAMLLQMRYREDFDSVRPKPMNLAKAKKYITEMLKFSGHEDTIKDAIEFYTKNVNETDQDGLREAVSQAFGDMGLVCPTVKFGEILAKKTKSANAYSYRLTRKLTAAKTFVNCQGWMGVCHFEEVPSVFGWPLYGFILPGFYSEDDKRFSRDLIQAWTDFAKIGKMGELGDQKWERALGEKSDQSSVQYLRLDLDNYAMVQHAYEHCDKLFKV